MTNVQLLVMVYTQVIEYHLWVYNFLQLLSHVLYDKALWRLTLHSETNRISRDHVIQGGSYCPQSWFQHITICSAIMLARKIIATVPHSRAPSDETELVCRFTLEKTEMANFHQGINSYMEVIRTCLKAPVYWRGVSTIPSLCSAVFFNLLM